MIKYNGVKAFISTIDTFYIQEQKWIVITKTLQDVRLSLFRI